ASGDGGDRFGEPQAVIGGLDDAWPGDQKKRLIRGNSVLRERCSERCHCADDIRFWIFGVRIGECSGDKCRLAAAVPQD
ncbi:MAG: hypothetical protein JNG88_03485, partial [Phycisphaerales bacterium]|nr:hypothetical protein [Phycisphaerales bacterium]